MCLTNIFNLIIIEKMETEVFGHIPSRLHLENANLKKCQAVFDYIKHLIFDSRQKNLYISHFLRFVISEIFVFEKGVF